MSNNPDEPVVLSDDERASLVERKATCPFIGSAVAQGRLPVLNDAQNPLASIEDVRRLGNKGGGDLGEVLVLFARGNQAFMRGGSGKLDRPTPGRLFSLEFPGSQGSHPGHSGILQGDPSVLDSGRLSMADFERLTDLAQDGLIKRSEVGRFIAENLHSDPNSKVDGKRVDELLAVDLFKFVETAVSAFLREVFGFGEDDDTTRRDVQEKFTKLTGEDNLVGSSGEFGLLFAFLANRPGAREVDGEPALAVEDLRAMFVDKRLPDGWETWKKLRKDWQKNTFHLMVSAAKHYHDLKRTRSRIGSPSPVKS